MKIATPLIGGAAAAVLIGAYAGTSNESLAKAALEKQAEKAPEPEIIAVKFHADWCGSCTAMGPVFEELQAKYDQQPVLYTVFDHTREFDRRQSAYMADAFNLDDAWDEHGGSTGFVLLIDADTKKVVKRLSHERGLKEMGAALKESVKKASSRSKKSEHPEHPTNEHPTGEHPR